MRRAAGLVALLVAGQAMAGGFETVKRGTGCPTLALYEEMMTAAAARDDRGWEHAMEAGCEPFAAGIEASVLRRGEYGSPRWIKVRLYVPGTEGVEMYTHPTSIGERE
ncbi:MAG: hypothetical protein ACQGVC_18110 [Myxococcota bacterium]